MGLLNSVMSAPAMNVRPAQARTTPVTSASPIAARMVSQSPWRTCRLKALTGGLSMVMTAMPSRTSS